MLADARTTSTLTSVRVRADLLLLGHRAVEFNFDLARASRPVTKMQKLPDLPQTIFAEARAEALAESRVAQHLGEWEALSLGGDPSQRTKDRAWD